MSQSPRRSIRNVTQLQSNTNNTNTNSNAASSVAAATPRGAIRALLAAPPTAKAPATGKRTRVTSRVVEEREAEGGKVTPRHLIRNVALFEQTPFTTRTPSAALAALTAATTATTTTSTAAQLPPPPPLYMRTALPQASIQPAAQIHAEQGGFDDDETNIVTGPRVRRGASSADRAHVRDLQAQLAAIGHQFVDPGAPVATLTLFPPSSAASAAAAVRRGKRVMTREHIEAIQRGRALSAEKRKQAAQQQSIIGGADARRHAHDDVADDDDDNDNAVRAGKKRRVGSMMPSSWVKDLFLAHAPGATMGADVLKTVLKLSDEYWSRAVSDLCAYAETKPRGAAVVSADDVELLFSRQRLTDNQRSVDDLAREFLPADLRREVVPIARANNIVEPALAHRLKKKKKLGAGKKKA